MDLRIDDNEAEVLNRVLRSWLPRLEQEAYATDSNHWGSDPMEDEAVIVSLVERLEAAAKNDGQADAAAALPVILEVEPASSTAR